MSSIQSEELPADPLAFRRVWTQARGQQAASSLVLKTFGVLYDAGRPLTRQELLEGLLSRLNAYEKAYLQAWDARRKGQLRAAVQRRKAKARGESAKEKVIVRPAIRTITQAAAHWIASDFDHRRYGETLIRDKDDRYRPGPRAPRMQTVEGPIVPFTLETRAAQEVAERNASQQAAMEMEWKRVQPFLEGVAGDVRLLVVAFLARRYAGAGKNGSDRHHVSEHRLRSICHHLLRANRPAVQHAILEQVLKWACESPPEGLPT